MQESERNKYTYRVKFTKEGPVRYTGHLDVMRFFQRAIRRANLPIAYSEGFSPHQILSFAFPLSVGYTSVGEYFDMELMEKADEEELVRRLNAASNAFFRILRAKELPQNAKNCMSVVFAAAYEVSFTETVPMGNDQISQFIDFISQSTIPVQKPKKKGGGFLEIDLKRFLYESSLPKEKDRTVAFTVNASSSDNIRPDFVAGCFLNYLGIEPPEHPYRVRRTEIYENAGTADEIVLKPLI